MRKMGDNFMTVRKAELLLNDEYDEAEHEEAFVAFDWQQFTDEEFDLCPPILAMGGDGAMLDIGFQNVSRLLASGKPIRVVVSHEEITELKLTEEALRKSREALEEQKQSLEEANIALKVLLKQREDDKLELERKVLSNVKELVLPYVEKLKNSRLRPKDKTLAEIIETHLNDIISPLLQKLSHARILLTPQEMQVASLVKDGRTSKEIADILNITEATVNFHRKNLRTKFGIKGKQANLRSYLLSIS